MITSMEPRISYQLKAKEEYILILYPNSGDKRGKKEVKEMKMRNLKYQEMNMYSKFDKLTTQDYLKQRKT